MKKVTLPKSIIVIQKPRVPAETKKLSEVTVRLITLDLNKGRLLAIISELPEPLVLLEGAAFANTINIQGLIAKIDGYVTKKLAPMKPNFNPLESAMQNHSPNWQKAENNRRIPFIKVEIGDP